MPTLPEQIENLIAVGKLKSGDRLPAERQLAMELGVSRSRLREAIKQLVSRGILISHRGGGTYVTSPEEVEPVRSALLSLAPLAQSESGYWRDVLEIRRSLEGDAAALAAERADDTDKAQIQTSYDNLAEAMTSGLAGVAKLDAKFHITIGRAAHNVVLYQILSGLEGLLEASISDSLNKLYRLSGVPLELDQQHRRILDAVLGGDANTARRAAIEHIDYVERRLESIEQENARRKRSALGLKHITTQQELSS